MKNKIIKSTIFSIVFLVLFATKLIFPTTSKGFVCTLPDLLALLNSIPGIDVSLQDRPWYDPTTCEFMAKVYSDPQDEIFGERYTFAQVNWITNSLLGLVFPYNLLFNSTNTLEKYLDFSPISQNPLDQINQYAQIGPSGIASFLIGYTITTPPASGIEYTKQIASKINIIQPVHAQGYGFNNITAVRNLWETSRNTSYILMVIFLMASGFLIIFRTKISPQTVVTAQLMLPRLIVTLILITFSYAIAGFVIDLIYVILSLVIFAITGSPQLVSAFTSSWSWSVITILYLISLAPIFLIPFGGPILSLILGIAIVWILFRTAWMLLRTYVELIILIITGPWQILFGLIPNSKNGPGFSSWITNLFAHSSVFIVVPIMFLFDLLLFFSPIIGLWRIVINGIPGLQNSQVSTLLDNLTLLQGNLPTLPFMPNWPNFIFSIIMSYVVLALIPRTAEIIRDSLKIPAFRYGNAFGEAMGPFRQPGQIYNRFVASQRAAEDRAIQADRLQHLASGPSSQQFMSGGVIEEIRRRFGI